MKDFIFVILTLVCLSSSAQVSGIVVELVDKNGKEKEESLPGAIIYWEHHDSKVISDEEGRFEIEAPDQLPDNLIFQFVGYPNDTIEIAEAPIDNVIMKYSGASTLEGVSVVAKETFISFMDPRDVRIISTSQLETAACCNLSESFERDATVDVSVTDAVSGTKKILMLGLDGVYTQMLAENIPTMRGLSAPYGLTFVPGPWIESISITKGTGSVVNGHESITGQFNMEFVKPDESPKLYLDGYVNNNLRTEITGYGAKKLNSKWSTMLYGKGGMLQTRVDRNNDSFLDMPLVNQATLFNRWKYQNGSQMFQFGVKGLIDDRTGGQSAFNCANDYGGTTNYGFGARSKQLEFFAKGGTPISKRALTSLALLSSFQYHDQKSYYGQRKLQWHATKRLFKRCVLKLYQQFKSHVYDWPGNEI